MDTTGVRELKNNLSRYLRRVEKGERIAVTWRTRYRGLCESANAAWQDGRTMGAER